MSDETPPVNDTQTELAAIRTEREALETLKVTLGQPRREGAMCGAKTAAGNPCRRAPIVGGFRSGPRIVDSVLSEISTGFQAAVFTATCSKYTASGVRRSSAVCRRRVL